jgi:hypothetical protein
MKDIVVGREYKNLTVIGEPFTRGRYRLVKVRCICGKEYNIRTSAIDKTNSCGCIRPKHNKGSRMNNKLNIAKTYVKDLKMICTRFNLKLDIDNSTINGHKIYFNKDKSRWFFEELKESVTKVVYNELGHKNNTFAEDWRDIAWK